MCSHRPASATLNSSPFVVHHSCRPISACMPLPPPNLQTRPRTSQKVQNEPLRQPSAYGAEARGARFKLLEDREPTIVFLANGFRDESCSPTREVPTSRVSEKKNKDSSWGNQAHGHGHQGGGGARHPPGRPELRKSVTCGQDGQVWERRTMMEL
jgi:hypothetical protein